MKMYILVKDDVPTRFAILAAAHASLAAYLYYTRITGSVSRNPRCIRCWSERGSLGLKYPS
jgi:hypothetical protein